jgi:hypothetical protein
VSSSVYGCAVDAEVELNRAFRDVVSSGETSRYGASKRTDLLRVGVCFAAVKVEDRDAELGVVVDVVGVWPWNCASSSSYCLRSLGSWVCRSELLFPHLSVANFFSSPPPCPPPLFFWLMGKGKGKKLTLQILHPLLQLAYSTSPVPRAKTPKSELYSHQSCCSQAS